MADRGQPAPVATSHVGRAHRTPAGSEAATAGLVPDYSQVQRLTEAAEAVDLQPLVDGDDEVRRALLWLPLLAGMPATWAAALKLSSGHKAAAR